MRPGYLGSLDGFWFGNLEGKHFEILEARSANPLYTIKDRTQGKTGEEFKTFIHPDWATTNIVQDKISDGYVRSPYWNNENSDDWSRLVADFRERSQIFKLTR
jgi:hypothetical protein